MSKLPIFGLFLNVEDLSRVFSWFFSRFFSIELGPSILRKMAKMDKSAKSKWNLKQFFKRKLKPKIVY